MDAEAARDVVGGRDHTAPTRVAADDERLRAERRILELLHGGVERVEIEVGNDHTNKCTGRRGRRLPPGCAQRSAEARLRGRALEALEVLVGVGPEVEVER